MYAPLTMIRCVACTSNIVVKCYKSSISKAGKEKNGENQLTI